MGYVSFFWRVQICGDGDSDFRHFHLDGTSTCRWYINRVRESSRYSPVPKPTCLNIWGEWIDQGPTKMGGGVYHSIVFLSFKKTWIRWKGDDVRRPFGGFGASWKGRSFSLTKGFWRWTTGMQTFYAQNGGILQIRLWGLCNFSSTWNL